MQPACISIILLSLPGNQDGMSIGESGNHHPRSEWPVGRLGQNLATKQLGLWISQGTGGGHGQSATGLNMSTVRFT
jgi:hypothetical protein